MKDWNVPGDEAIFDIDDLAAAARGMGAQAQEVSRPGDLGRAMANPRSADSPILLDVTSRAQYARPSHDHV